MGTTQKFCMLNKSWKQQSLMDFYTQFEFCLMAYQPLSVIGFVFMHVLGFRV